MESKVPLVYYKEIDGKQVRVVIGECEVSEDGTVTGEITNSDDDHVFKAMIGGGGKFIADVSGYFPDGKFIMRQHDSDGMPVQPKE